MKMDKVANSGNDEFYTPNYAVSPIVKYIPAPPKSSGVLLIPLRACL